MKRTCPGEEPTIQVSVVPRTAVAAAGAPGNALVLDASTDTPDDPVVVRVVWADDSSLTLAYDRRARVIRREPRAGAVALRWFPATQADLLLGQQALVGRWGATRRPR